MKIAFFTFATLALLSRGLRVADRVKAPEDMTPEKVSYRAAHMPQEHLGIMTYNTQNGMEWLDGVTGNQSWNIRSILTGKKKEATGGSIIMRAHRRSGIQLAKNVSNCVAKHADPDQIARITLFPRTLEGDFTEENLATSNTPTLHFVRNPVEWVISWYKYVKQEQRDSDDWQFIDWSSDWMTRRGSMKETHGEDEDLTAFLQAHGQWIDYDEPISKFFKRVPADIGMAVAYREVTTDILPKAVKFAQACKTNPTCKQVCLESFTNQTDGGAAFMDTWSRIFNEMLDTDLDAQKNEQLKQCIENQRKFTPGIRFARDIRRETILDGINTGMWGATTINSTLRSEYYGILHQLDRRFGWELQKIMKSRAFSCDY